MATISNASLLVENFNNTTVKLTVKYTLTPSAVEKLAGTVFHENIQLIGDDPGIVSDIIIANFSGDNFAVTNATPTVARTRTRNLLKSALNEDPGRGFGFARVKRQNSDVAEAIFEGRQN